MDSAIVMFLIEIVVIFTLSVFITRECIRFATHYHIGDEPGPRKVHKTFKPYLGGLAIYLALVIGLAIIYLIKPSMFNQAPPYYVHSALACTFIMLIGLLDDLLNLSFGIKFLAQIIASLIIIYGGMVIQNLYIPGIGLIHLGYFSYPFTILWIIFITNALNLLDGLDGLAAGVSAIILVFFFIISLLTQRYFLAITSLGLCIALIGFLIYNYHPAKIFMGDAGSLFLGFAISLFSLEIMYLPPEKSVHLLIPLTIMAVPVSDTIISFFRRTSHKMHPFKADRDHIHHRLMDIGFSHLNSVRIIYLMTAFFGLLGFSFFFLDDREVITIVIITMLLLAILIRRLGYIEIEKNLLFIDSEVENGNNHLNNRFIPFDTNKFFQTIVFLFFDFIAIASVTYICYLLVINLNILKPIPTRELILYLSWITIFWLLLIGLNDLYRIDWDCSRIDEIVKINKIVVIGGVLLLLALSIYDPALLVNIRVFIIYFVLLGISLSFFRISLITISKKYNLLDFKEKPTLIFGTSEKAQKVLKRIRSVPELKFRVVGFIDERSNGKIGTKILGIPVLGGLEDVPFIIRRKRIREVIIALDTRSNEEIFNVIALCNQFNIGIKLIPDFYSLLIGFRTQRIYGVSLIKLFTSNMLTWEWILKRVIDIVVSIFILVAFLPIWIVIAILIKLDSPGPIFYKQERVGKNKQVFNLIKFRSMIENAEEITGPKWAEADDPRVTRIGRFLRNTGLDEVPQFINVLMGKMSIVGPRPERPYFVNNLEKNIKFYSRRLIVKPGITGWAQIKHKYDETIDDVKEKLRFDLYYIQNMSILLDIKIIIQTLLVSFRRKQHLSSASNY